MTITFTRGSRAGERIQKVLAWPAVVIGRSHSAEIRLPDPEVSGRHIEITVAADGMYAMCLSRRGFKWNGLDVRQGERQRLAVGDEIAIGERVCFRVGDIDEIFAQGSKDAWLGAIQKQVICGDTSGAVRNLEYVLRFDPSNLRAKLLLGTCYRLQGDVEGFKRIYREIMSLGRNQGGSGQNNVVCKWAEQFSAWDDIEEIRKLIITEEAEKVMAAVKALLSRYQGSDLVKMVYGACCLALGEEEAFKRIYGEIAAKMEGVDFCSESAGIILIRYWQKYHEAFTVSFGSAI